MKQCEADTLPSTYSRVHRCLKPSSAKKVGGRALCSHHRALAARKLKPA